MSEKLKNFIKLMALLTCLIIMIIIYAFYSTYNNAKLEEENTPLMIVPKIKRTVPATKPQVQPSLPQSDYKVPEIG